MMSTRSVWLCHRRHRAANTLPVRQRKRQKPVQQHVNIIDDCSNDTTDNSAEDDRNHDEYQQSLKVLTVARKWASIIDSLSENYLIYVGIHGEPSTEIVTPSTFSCGCEPGKVHSSKPVRMYFFHGKLCIV